jgi:glycosyl hydrolase family 53
VLALTSALREENRPGEGPLRPADPFWHGPVSALRKNLDDLATRYGNDVMIAEDQYAWTFADGDSTDNFFWDDPSGALARQHARVPGLGAGARSRSPTTSSPR